MLTKRIIPCLDVKEGKVVKGRNFLDLKQAGDAVELAKRYNEEGADELVFLIDNRHGFNTPLQRQVADFLRVTVQARRHQRLP